MKTYLHRRASVSIGTVTKGDEPSVTVTENNTLNFVLPKGDQGIQGIQGEKGDTGDMASNFSEMTDNIIEGICTIGGDS